MERVFFSFMVCGEFMVERERDCKGRARGREIVGGERLWGKREREILGEKGQR